MDMAKFENSIPRPNRFDFWVKVKATAPSGVVHEVKVFEEELYRKALAAYKDEVRSRQNAFRQELLEELGIINHPKAELLYSKAWELGHSSGYSEVVNWAWDLVDLIR